MVQITLPNSEILEAELARTHLKRISGLSGYKEKKSMLFVFPLSMKWAFWMPNMYYSIKIIYLNKDKEVVDLKDAFPMTRDLKTWKRYTPQKACKYVLETPFEHNIKIGDKLIF
jgi:uncharacterized membrane protein (UPF0127 family)